MENGFVNFVFNFPYDSGFRILGILAVSLILQLFSALIIKKSAKLIGRQTGERREYFEKRIDTLAGVAASLVTIAIWSLAFLIIISELGINITPILTGAGILGLVVGFGAQNVVRDFLAGVFILLENQYSKGDEITVAGLTGRVEDINFRRTTIRDISGTVHYVPNGQITTTSNFSKKYSHINLDVSIAYAENLDRVFEVLNKVGKDLAKTKRYGDLINKHPQVLRVESLGDSAITVKMLGEAKAGKQAEVLGGLRKAIKEAFDKEKIKFK